MNRYDVSVVICTRDRADSLAETLRCLADADRFGVEAEVVVVDNGSRDETVAVARCFADRIPVRILTETAPGKAPSLNRALAEGGLGSLVVLLDDDMSVHPDWFQGVRDLSARHPEHDVFTGRSYVIWPDGEEIPAWARLKSFHPWAFSVLDFDDDHDRPLRPGHWPSGNHFWFRSRVLAGGRRFDDMWNAEGKFNLRLQQDGYRGMIGPDAVAGHRIQPELLRRDVIRSRAWKTGVNIAQAQLPQHRAVHQAAFFHRHPWLSRMLWVANLLRWGAVCAVGSLHPSSSRRFEIQTRAILALGTNWERLRIASRVERARIADERE